MNRTGKLRSLALALLIAVVPLTACSQGSGQTASAVQTGGKTGGNSGIRIVGKVTSVVGNQVTLAVGTLNRGSGTLDAAGAADAPSGADPSNRSNFRRSQSSGTASQSSVSSAAPSSGGISASGGTTGGSSSDLITLTGETKTILIPVGLTLSQGGMSGGKKNGSAGTNGSAGGSASGDVGQTQRPSGGGQTQRPSGGSQTAGGGTGFGRSNGTGTGTTAAIKKSSDFSSIKKGMVLQIFEQTLSDGTQNVVQVRVLSE